MKLTEQQIDNLRTFARSCSTRDKANLKLVAEDGTVTLTVYEAFPHGIAELHPIYKSSVGDGQ